MVARVVVVSVPVVVPVPIMMPISVVVAIPVVVMVLVPVIKDLEVVAEVARLGGDGGDEQGRDGGESAEEVPVRHLGFSFGGEVGMDGLAQGNRRTPKAEFNVFWKNSRRFLTRGRVARASPPPRDDPHSVVGRGKGWLVPATP